MTDIAFRAIATASAPGGGTIYLTLPASTQVGDYVVAYFTWAATPTSFTPPAGWTVLRPPQSGYFISTAICGFRATAPGTTTHTFGVTGSTGTGETVASVWSGVHPSAPVDAVSASSTSNVRTAPSITTLGPDRRLVYNVATDIIGYTPPAGMTEHFDSTVNYAHEVASELIATAGPTGSRTATQSASGGTASTGMVALRPDRPDRTHQMML